MNSVNQEFGFFFNIDFKYITSRGRSGFIHSEKNSLGAYTLISGRIASRKINAMVWLPNHPASPIGKNIPNREANDAKGSIQKGASMTGV